MRKNGNLLIFKMAAVRHIGLFKKNSVHTAQRLLAAKLRQ